MGDAPAMYEITVNINEQGEKTQTHYFVMTEFLPIALNTVLDRMKKLEKDGSGKFEFEGIFSVSQIHGRVLQPE